MPSLRVVEALSTSSSAGRGLAISTVYNRVSRDIPNLPLLVRSNVKAQVVVIIEDLGMSLCSGFVFSTNVKLKR